MRVLMLRHQAGDVVVEARYAIVCSDAEAPSHAYSRDTLVYMQGDLHRRSNSVK